MVKTHKCIAVDFDGTLAEYHGWVKWDVLGKPIPAMVERVKGWLAEGHEVWIFTARVCESDSVCKVSGEAFTVSNMAHEIMYWTLAHIGDVLPVTAIKHWKFDEFWDDRAIQVEPNTGRSMIDVRVAEAMAAKGGP